MGEIDLDFDDVIAEPKAAHGFDPVWRLSFILFSQTKLWTYRILAALLAAPLSILWGVLVSPLSLLTILFCEQNIPTSRGSVVGPSDRSLHSRRLASVGVCSVRSRSRVGEPEVLEPEVLTLLSGVRLGRSVAGIPRGWLSGI